MATEALQIDALWAGLNDPDTGQSYSGAIVGFFESGTTTPKAVWLDKEKTLPTTAGLSQTTLDSNGVAQIYGDGVYKINVYAPTDTGLTTPLSGSIDGATYRKFDNILSIDTIADLRLEEGEFQDQTAIVKGYYAAGDGGGGPLRIWDEGQAVGYYTDNGGSIIVPTGGDGSAAWLWVEGNEYIFPEWFGSTSISASSAIKSALDYTVANQGIVKGIPGNTYIIDERIIVPANSKMDFTGATLERGSAYTTDQSAFLGTFSTGESLELIGGLYKEVGTKTEPYFQTSGGDIKITGCTFEDAYIGIESRTSDNVEMTMCMFNACTYGFDFDNSVRVNVHHNTFENMTVGAGRMSAISSGSVHVLKFNNNIVDTTGDTALFMRAFTGAVASEMNASNNTFRNIGKGAIKFTNPASADGALIENCIANGNVIRGYSLNVLTSAIASFKDAGNTTSVIKNVAFIGNVIDGRDTDGNLTALTTGTSGAIRATHIQTVSITGNTIENVPFRGIWVDNCQSGSVVGNSVNKAAQNSANNGIWSSDNTNMTFDNTVTNTGNSSSGLYMLRTRQCKVSGNYCDNGNYGIEEDGSGAAEVRTTYNTYRFVALGNTTGPILYYTNSESSEVGSIDDNGTRIHGTTTVRDALGFGNSNSLGFSFYNTTTSKSNFHVGANSWVLYDGTAA